ncbi:hypothetical protein PPERSA_04782 [Pseudocohnilembus persalinus]|uniref:Transporter n=1 Tax=Pseudocohnilembus persalinus TaxID=266149 RepID=A0A0V0Q9J4_PSEPJ|nr:hypothetical protein PPERSA_04782 [Pseudocohnilembus persalinus]|eukprot:KRW98849.1 hypothetical protein PPERSA_04782 [Pseudocohnilembus persalinus]
MNNMEKFDRIEEEHYDDPEDFDEVSQRHLNHHNVSLMRPSVSSNESEILGNSHQKHERDRFNNYLEYVLTVLGFAAGFGSLWRFPYLVYKNGGGAFLIPYCILLVVIGIPAFYLETCLGQLYQKGPPKIFESFGKRFKGIGYMAILIAFNECTYYNLILGYSMYYLWKSFQFPLPWSVDQTSENEVPWNTSYFYDDVLKSTDSINELGGMVWPLFLCYCLSQLVVFLCIQKGVAVSGRIALFTATSPYILLFLLMIRGFFLDGAWDGIAFLLTPDLNKLTELTVWSDAAAQVIFQFSAGIGILVFFGSYRDKRQEVQKTSIQVPLLTCLCGFLSAFAVFSFMGYMAKQSNLTISELPLAGPDLTFIAYPAVITMMPFQNFWAVIFYLVMIFLGIDTQFGFIDGLAGTIEDDHLTHRGIKIGNRYFSSRVCRFFINVTVMLTGFLYCSQGGFYFLEFVDSYTTSVPSLLSIGFEVVFFTHYNDWVTLEKKIIRYIKTPTPKIYIIFLKYVIPVVTFGLAASALYNQILKIGDQSFLITLFGWVITSYPIGTAFYYYFKYKDIEEQEEIKNQLLKD